MFPVGLPGLMTAIPRTSMPSPRAFVTASRRLSIYRYYSAYPWKRNLTCRSYLLYVVNQFELEMKQHTPHFHRSVLNSILRHCDDTNDKQKGFERLSARRGGNHLIIVIVDTFNMPTSYEEWVWEREAHIHWSMVTCQGSVTRLELPSGLLALGRRTLCSERHRYAIA